MVSGFLCNPPKGGQTPPEKKGPDPLSMLGGDREKRGLTPFAAGGRYGMMTADYLAADGHDMRQEIEYGRKTT